MKKENLSRQIVTICVSVVILITAILTSGNFNVEQTYITKQNAVYNYLKEKGISLDDNENSSITIPYRLLNNAYPEIYSENDTCIATSYAIVTKKGVETVETCHSLGSILLYGNEEITLEVGSSYIEEGAYIDGTSNQEIKVNSTVDTTRVGSYVVNYYVEDNSVTAALRIVHVVDTKAPEIHLNGSETIYLNQGSLYQELGATATDNYDEHVTVTIDASKVDTTTAGTYEVVYRAMDAAQNETIVKRTVIVRENSPIITLKGTSIVYLNYKDTYTEAGFEAYNYDGTNITKDVVITGTVDTNQLGTYQLQYTVANADGRKVTVTRMVVVQDKQAPALTLKGDTTITLEWGTPYTEAGFEAIDNVDGNITKDVIQSGIFNASKVGVYYLTYTSVDKAGNKAIATRIIKVVDTKAPQITLTGDSKIFLNAGREFEEPGFKAIDNYDGDITANVSVDYSTIKNTVFGTYTITYTVTDSSLNTTTVTREVVVEDKEKPVITLNGAKTVYVEYGSTYQDRGALVTDNYDAPKNITGTLYDQDGNEVSSVHNVGTYTMKYNATDSSSNVAEEVTRTIIVRDTQKPVVSLEKDTVSGYQKETNVKVYVIDKNSPIKTVRYAVTTSQKAPSTSAYQEFVDYDMVQNNTLSLKNLTGIYYVHVIAIDVHNNQSLPVTLGPISFDNEAPIVSLTPNGLEAGRIETVLQVTDKESGVREVLCAWSNQNQTAPTSYETCTNGTLQKEELGSYYLWIKAVDRVGNEQLFVSNIFTAAKEKPIIQFQNHETLTKAPISEVTFTAAGSKTIAKVEYAWTEVGKTPIYKTYTGAMENPIRFTDETLSDGEYQLWIKATDSENETSTAVSTIFTVDRTAPSVTIIAPNAPVKSANITVDIEENVLKNVYRIVSTDRSISMDEFTDATLWTNYASSHSFQITGVTGTYYVHILAVDEAGNETYYISNPIILDNEAPLPAEITPNVSGDVWTKDDVRVTLTSEEGTIYYHLGTGSWQEYTTPVVIDKNNTTIYARVMDEVGNYSEVSSLTIQNIDRIAPSIDLTYDKTWTSNIKVNYSIKDQDSQLASIRYGFSSSNTVEPIWQEIDTTEGTGSINKNDVDGTYYLWVEAIDNAGNREVTITEALYLDKTLPVVTFETNPSKLPQTSFTIPFIVNEENIESIVYAFSTQEEAPSDGYTTFQNYSNSNNQVTLSYKPTGRYYLYVIVTDKAGNQVTARTSYTYQLVNETPNIEINPSNQLDYSKEIAVVIDVTTLDFVETNKMEYVWLKADQNIEDYTGTWTTFDKTTKALLTGATGSYKLYVRVIDNVDGSRVTTSQAGIYNVDMENPEITITPNGTTGFINRAKVLISATDGVSGIKSLGYAWTTSATEAPSRYTTVANQTEVMSPEETNTYYLWVQAVDQAGNIETIVSAPYHIDNSYPEIVFRSNHGEITNELAIKAEMLSKGNKTIEAIYYAWTSTDTPLEETAAEWILLGNYTEAQVTHEFTNETTMSDGTYYLQVKVVDSNHYVTTAVSSKYILDTTAAEIILTPEGSTTPSQEITVSVEIEEASKDFTVFYEWSTNQTPSDTMTEWTSFTGNGDTLSLENETDGTYYLHILVIDAANNRSTKTVSYILDTTAPVITVTGGKVTVEAGDAYVEPGVLAEDAIDGEVQVTVSWDKPFNNKVLGTYTITYTAEDRAGNVATATRTVEVVDTKAPVLTLVGDSVIELTFGDTYQELGATAIDNLDGDISDKINITGEVLSNVGTYTITYTVTDEHNNTATITRTVRVVPRKLTVTIQDKTSVYGDPFATLTWEITSGTANKEDLNITLTKATGNTVGDYAITGTIDDENYEITFVDGVYSITKRDITVTIDDKTSIYGEAFKPLTSSITSGTVLAGDELNIELQKEAGSDIGTYAITGTYNNNNYNVTFIDGIYTITKQAITITVDNKTSVYGDPLETLTYTITSDREVDEDSLKIVLSKEAGTNVGTYVITATADNDNYDITIVDGVYTITKRNVTVTIDNKTSVYGNVLESLTWDITSGTLLSDETLNVVLSKEEGTDAGTYAITGTYNNDNYDVTFVDGVYTITKRNVTVTIDNKTSVYGDALETLTSNITKGDVLAGDDLEITLTKEEGTDFGTYAITGIAENENYNVTFINGIYTITKRNIEVTMDDKTSIYGEALETLTWTVTDGTVVAGDTLDITANKETGNSVGSYAITGTTTNENYAIDFIEGTYTITKRAVTVTIDNKASVYGNPLKGLTYSVTSGTIIAGDRLGIVLSKEEGTDIGKYAITGTYSNDNYDVTIIDGIYTITKYAVTITIHDKTSIYGDTLETLSWEITEGNVANQDELNIELVKEEGTDAGSYAITGTYNNDNYDVTFVDGTYTITKRAVTVTIDNKTSVYGEVLETLTSSVTNGTVVAGDDLGLTLAKAAGNAVGSYAITGTANNDNYDVTFVDGTYEITKRAVTVTIDNKTSVYGEALEILTSSITSGNLLAGDDLGLTLSKEAGIGFGTYAITGTASNDNYDVTFINGIYTITKRAITVTIDNKTSIYGETLETLTSSITAGTIVEGDNINLVLTKEEGTNVGTYAITGTASNDNYDITIINGIYTITKRAITVTIDNKTSVYGEALETLTSNITTGSLAEGDDLGLTLTKAAGNSVGSYPITGTVSNNNYDVTFVDGIYTITKRAVIVTIDDKTSVYGASLKALTYRITTGDLILEDNLNIDLVKEEGTDVGTYTITGTYNNDNYDVTIIDGTYTITKRAITVTIDDKTSIYGDPFETLTSSVTTGNLVEGDDLNINLVKEEGKRVGSYAITGTYNNDNYDVTIIDGTYTITKRAITVTIDNKTSVYGEALESLTYDITSGNLLSGDTLNVTLSKEEGSSVGSYAITGTYNNNNYDVTFVNGIYTITKRAVTVTIDDKISIYGNPIETLTSSITTGALIEGDTLDIVLSKEEGTSVGTYTITGTSNDKNYDITFVDGTYTITKRAITITMDDKTSIYGNPLETLTSSITTGTIVEGDNLNIVPEKEAGNNVGTYTITGTATNANYDITIVDGIYTITKRAVTITTDDKTSVYGEAFETLTSTVTEGSVLETDELNIVLSKEVGTDVGTYTITGNATNTNYDITIVDGTYTITKRNLTVTIDDKTSVYGEAFETLTWNITSGTVINNDELNIVVTKATGNNAGTYAITGTYNNNNYNVTFIDGTYTITKALPTYVVPSGLTAEYGKTLADVTLPEGFTFNQPLTTPVGNLGANAFTVTYTPEDSDNYSSITNINVAIIVSDTTAPTITILGQKEITIAVGSTYQDQGAIASDLHDGDLTSKITTSGTVNTSKVGTYTITYKVTDSSNNEATITRTVHVVDEEKPVITLNGSATVTIEYGYGYNDAGAKAQDNYDGDLTSKIQVVSNVNPDKIGTYTVTYNVTDANGNVAQTVTRTVKVTAASLKNKVINKYNCTGSECYASATTKENYLWYSGELWRIIKVNSDGSILMVTDRSLTSMPYGYMSSVYNDSYAKTWLNNVFYKKLDNPSAVLNTNATWCNDTTEDTSSKRTTCTTSVTSPVGMLTLDQYNLAGGKSSYLSNGSTFFTMTPSGTSHVHAVRTNGDVSFGYYVYYNAGIRATVSLKASLLVQSGNGTKANPYHIANEKVVTKGQTIKDRLPGEYITFAGQTWRIISHDSDGTKLLMDTYYKENGSMYLTTYGKNDLNVNDGIGKYLNTTVYNNIFTRVQDQQKLVSTKWYINEHNYGVDPQQYIQTPSTYYMTAKVGLISIGELGAVSNSNFPTDVNFWIANKLINGRPWYISSASTGELGYDTDERTIRPAIKIKSDTIINGGIGTLESPITLQD